MTAAQAKIVQTLNSYVHNFGGEVILRLQEYEKKVGDMLHDLHDLDLVREDPKFHGDVSSLEHSLEVVKLLHHLYLFLFNQEKSELLRISELERITTLLPSDFRLEKHLASKIGKHSRKELLFFACLFHDIGKLKNFVHLMSEVEEGNVKGITRFLHHADFGRLYFFDELTAIEERIAKFEQDLAKESNSIKQKFYRTALAYLHKLHQDFKLREDFFRELELGKAERKYLAFVIKNHMDLLNFYNNFLQARNEDLAGKNTEAQKILDTLSKSLVKKVEEYEGFYLDCILLNFCDLLESSHSAGSDTAAIYLFLEECFLIFVNYKGLLTGGKIIFREHKLYFQEKSEKPAAKYNWGKLFNSIFRDKAQEIKRVISEAEGRGENPAKALAQAGYSAQIGEIFELLKS